MFFVSNVILKKSHKNVYIRRTYTRINFLILSTVCLNILKNKKLLRPHFTYLSQGYYPAKHQRKDSLTLQVFILRKLGYIHMNDFWTPPPPINFVHGSDKKCLNLT